MLLICAAFSPFVDNGISYLRLQYDAHSTVAKTVRIIL